jgi:lysozyme
MLRPSLLLAASLLVLVFSSGCVHSNSVVNLSHYDTMTPDFARMKREGIVGVIHESTYPPAVVDEKYAARQDAATRAGLLWGAYHFANASDPVRQADLFVDSVAAKARSASARPAGVLMVLDFETNAHYPGGTMTVPQAAAFVRRVHQRTGKYPGLYSNENRVKKVLGDPRVSAADRHTLRQCWLWIANYHYQPKATGPWGEWTMWQYTGDGTCDLPRSSHPTRVANIPKAERNLFKGSRSGAISFWRAHAWRVR